MEDRNGRSQNEKGAKIMSNIQVFSNDSFNVRTVEDNGEVWFVAKDIAEALEYSEASNTARIFQSVPEIWCEVKRIHLTSDKPTARPYQEMLCLSEQGLYFFLGRSDKKKALPYQMWIAGEVIPSIRKHGAYLTPKLQEELITNPDFIIRLAQELKAERAKAQALTAQVAAQTQQISVQTQQIAELQPKASYYDVILACKDLLAITTIAKDYGWSGQKMNGWLKNQGVQFKQGDIWLLYQKYAEMGYTSTKTGVFLDGNGETHSKVHTYWTQKGRLFIYELMKAAGNLPLIEKGE